MKGRDQQAKVIFGVATGLLILMVILLGGSEAAFASCGKNCSMTSKAARKACFHEARDDYWIAKGICFNLSDWEEMKECFVEAKEEYKEVREECGEQYEARQEICEELGEGPYDPEIDPENFMDKAMIMANPNPYFPLVPGNEWVYEAEEETITVTVTDDTREIMGVTTIVVRDVATEDGEIIEDTFDWYAMDQEGNIWYFGEIAKNYEDGELRDLEGSWEAGRDGAKPGILIKANPEVGEILRQEFLLGEAEDMAEVLAIDANESAGGGAYVCSDNCLQTSEFTPLEPDVEEEKFYLPGVGLIVEVDLESGDRVELVSFTSTP